VRWVARHLLACSLCLAAAEQQFEDRGMDDRRPPRLYLTARLAHGGAVEPEAGQVHYLRSVLRLGAGAAVAAFNETDGEWL
jgi:hypothetical protein